MAFVWFTYGPWTKSPGIALFHSIVTSGDFGGATHDKKMSQAIDFSTQRVTYPESYIPQYTTYTKGNGRSSSKILVQLFFIAMDPNRDIPRKVASSCSSVEGGYLDSDVDIGIVHFVPEVPLRYQADQRSAERRYLVWGFGFDVWGLDLGIRDYGLGFGV